MNTTDRRANLLASIVTQLTGGINTIFDRIEQDPVWRMDELEGEVRQLSRDLFGAVVGATLELMRPAVEAEARCPQCGAIPRAKGVHRRCQETSVGSVTWWRQYDWCPHCRQGWYPLDEATGIVPGAFSDALQAMIGRLGASVPFAAAAETVEQVIGISVGVRTVERLTEHHGQALEVRRDAEWAALCDGQTVVPTILPRTETGTWAVALDAARLRVDGGWHEAKAGVVGWIPANERRTTELSYLSVVGGLEAAGERLALEAWHRGCDPLHERVVCLADGAPGNWTQFATHFPQRVEVLDWWHAVEHLWAAANGVFGEGTAPAKRWVAARRTRLWEGRVDLVLRALRRAAERPHGEAAAAEIAYFATNAARMDYADFRAHGYPIASGAVESACKRLIGARTKQAGMAWTRAGAQGVLSLRAELLSGRWDASWPLTRAA